jgi:hypothetical protein
MVESRTKSMELRAIREQMNESPPPPPAGASVREWFAGLALMNPTLMEGLSPCERAVEAVRLADELVRALVVPRTPSQESMAVPTDETDLHRSWNNMADNIASAKTKKNRPTKPEMKRCHETSLPPPIPTLPTVVVPKAIEHFRRASDMLDIAAKALLSNDAIPNAGRYSSLTPDSTK